MSADGEKKKAPRSMGNIGQTVYLGLSWVFSRVFRGEVANTDSKNERAWTNLDKLPPEHRSYIPLDGIAEIVPISDVNGAAEQQITKEQPDTEPPTAA